ncbi:muscarinic acetylcholine receptor gar-2-like [Watersipora subatra]|uniref:muscarinic acetylcholine receptor gar-2-like n=1 Tax=Watersipora subatra TaxID=2589382 RepID=UPI00355C712D
MAAVTSICTAVGNILVVYAFIVEKNLRQASNYLIVSLAVTDILIGIFSMPLYTLYLLKRYWPLGQILCDLWLSLDFTVCLVSQYTVFLITLDRFCSVKAPAKYRNWRTKRRMKIMIAITWLFPAFIFFTSIMGWRTFTGSDPPTDKSCVVEFQSDQLFTVVLVISYYWVTLIIMVGLYIGIYRVAWALHAKAEAKRNRMSQVKRFTRSHGRQVNDDFKLADVVQSNGSKSGKNYDEGKANSKVHHNEAASDSSNELSSQNSSSAKQDSNGPEPPSTSNTEQTENFFPSTSLSESPLWKPRDSFESANVHWEVNGNSVCEVEGSGLLTKQTEEMELQCELEPNTGKNKLLAHLRRVIFSLKPSKCCVTPQNNRQKSKSENRARKALRTISFILGAFVVCWTPYHVLIIVYSFCPNCVNSTFFDFTYWLCYMNSPLNPFCYAFSNVQFKNTFIKIFQGKYFSSRHRCRR